MTRKDYVSVAESLAKTAGSISQEDLYYIADMIAMDMGEQNPKFDYDLFLENSGVTKETIERANA